MAFQAVFKRYELKYMLTRQQKEIVLQEMAEHMQLDQYGRTTIRNIYFDTDDYRLIRRSIEKPAYKEKLRIRSYRQTTDESSVFVELKKKFDGVVYKRRVSMPMDEALGWICDHKPRPSPCQITREIDYFTNFYGSLRPAVFLSYDRIAYYAKDGSDFRITFDRNICCRQEDLRLDGDVAGTPILPPGMTMMEIKSIGGMPLWMTKVLTREQIFKTSFSKYGTAYQTLIFPNQEVFVNGRTV